MRRILFLILLIGLCLGYDRNYLMDSEDFPFEGDLLACKMFRSLYPKSRLTDYDLVLIVNYGKFYNISPLVYFCKLEQENNLFRNANDAHTMPYEMRYRRAFAYWLWNSSHEGFEKQLYLFSWQMNDYRRFYPGPGKPFTLDQKHGVVYPVSEATFYLYKYTPFYGVANNMGYLNIGNRNFELIYQELKFKWKTCVALSKSMSNSLLTIGQLQYKINPMILTNDEPAFSQVDSPLEGGKTNQGGNF